MSRYDIAMLRCHGAVSELDWGCSPKGQLYSSATEADRVLLAATCGVDPVTEVFKVWVLVVSKGYDAYHLLPEDLRWWARAWRQRTLLKRRRSV